MADAWLLALPENSPVHFGRALERMTITTLPASNRRDRATYYLAEQVDMDYSMLRAFMNGKLFKPQAQTGKELTLERLAILVKYFMGRPGGLSSPEEARKWASLASKSLARLLDSYLSELPCEQESSPSSLLATMPHLPGHYAPRNDLEQELKNLLPLNPGGKETSHCGVIISGIPGIGKSTLVNKVIRSLENQREVLWINCQKRSAATIMANMAAEMGLQPRISEDETLYLLKRKLAEKQPLLVLDGGEDLSAVQHLSSLLPDLFIIWSTRLQISKADRSRLNMAALNVPPMSVEEGCSLIARIAGEITDQQQQQALTAILEKIECHPLSIELLVGFADVTGFP